MGVALQTAPAPVKASTPVVNDFAITVATANGTGSQTSNLVLLRTFFNMGIPVTGKNLFPSNIQGLPTWYSIRLSEDGYLARREGTEIVVCMNGRTVADDMADVAQGGVVFYDNSLPIAARREDVTYYAIPVGDLVKAGNIPANLRDYVANMVYVGALAWFLKIPLAEIEKVLNWQLSGKAKAVKLNMDMIQSAYDWAQGELTNQNLYTVDYMHGFNEGKILTDGNMSAALGAIFGGVSMVSWYPITPSSSLAEGLLTELPRYRTDPDTGKATYAVIQAEDELAAIGMVLGAGWAGARAMTATSGPGISLMAEFAGLAYFAEIPSVIWDVQRMGPSTGLPTRVSQGDILSAYTLSHGDTRHPVLFPASPKECFEFGHVALDLADQAQTLVMVLSDLDLGMNLWISDPFEYPETPIQRGKVLDAEQVKALAGKWGRYMDTDGDGIPYRTLPGTETPMAAYFTRGTGHDDYARYTEDSGAWERNLIRLRRKFETIREMVPAPAIEDNAKAEIGIISLGSNDAAVEEARDRLAKVGTETAYLRLRALPISQSVRDFINRYETIVIVENNFDGQLHKILLTEEPTKTIHMNSAATCTGMPISARWIVEQVQKVLAEKENTL